MWGPAQKEAALTALIILEYLALAAALAWAWRRSRIWPRRRIQLTLILSALLQAAVLVGVRMLMEAAFRDPAAAVDRVPEVAWSVLPLQVLRAGLLLVALTAWLRLVRDDLARKSIWIPLGLGILLHLTGTPGLYTVGGFLVFFTLLRLRWADRVSGFRRVLWLLFSPLMVIPFLFSFSAVVSQGQVSLPEVNFSNAPPINLLLGELTGSAAVADRLVGPWERLIWIVGDLLRLHFMVAFLKFLVLPVHLRGLSLKRRFTVTTALYRLVPGALGLIAVVLGVYFGMGIHKNRMVRVNFESTVDDAAKVAERIIENPALAGGAAGRAELEAMRPWLGGEAERAHLVLRRTDTAPGDSAAIRTLNATATEGTPAALLERLPFPELSDTTQGGMVVGDRAFFLAAARTRAEGGGAVTAEVYVPVDSLYLARIARRVGADIRLQFNPRLSISNSAVITSDAESADAFWGTVRFRVSAAAVAQDSTTTGLWRGRRYIARQFIPLGDWFRRFDDERRGALLMTLDTSPRSLVTGIFAQPYVLPSNIFATATFLVILFLFVIAELSAARTGRSIIRGILQDVQSLSRAAKRIGEGDLDHRIELRGKDELGSLAATFNDMAANLKRHQRELLEKERLERDLALARDIQQRLLPQGAPRINGLDVAGVSLPSREVGGDLFYFLPQENRLGVAIGDVSGKSVPAALLMSNVLAALRAETRFPIQPHEILAHINELIAQQVETGKFVTFIYGVVDPRQGGFHYSSAGHNPPLKVSAGGEGEWLPVSGIALGILPESEYTPSAVPLGPGDVLVLYSDGVTEAEREPATAPAAVSPGAGSALPDDGGSDESLEFFEERRLLETVRAARHGSANEIVEAVLNAVREFTGDAPQSDDLTLVVVKVRGDA